MRNYYGLPESTSLHVLLVHQLSYEVETFPIFINCLMLHGHINLTIMNMALLLLRRQSINVI